MNGRHTMKTTRALGAFLILYAAGCISAPGRNAGMAGGHERDAGAPDPNVTADDAVDELQAGNARFCRGETRHPHQSKARRLETADHGQHPFATVVACSDSRVPVELLFDQGIGDLFVIRVAGNVCGEDETGSIEYAVEHLATPVVIVLGHESCGAVTAVVQSAHEEGSLQKLLQHIGPAVRRVRSEHAELEGPAFVAAAVKQNVSHSMEDLLTHSRSVREAVAEERLSLVGAVYNLHSGEVEWLGAHPEEAALIGEAP